MHISSDTNPINLKRLSAASTEPLSKKVQAESVSAVKEADVFSKGLLADLKQELKEIPEIRKDVVASAARDLETMDLKEFGSRLAAELNRFEPTESK
ncbi:MAG: hypothetical protein ACPGF8_03695 [Opitutales bacterium]